MTFSLLLESALRSLMLALAVWGGMRVFRVRNVLAQKAAWGVVLASALTMPIVLPMASHWNVLPANVRVAMPADPETMLEELQARIKATPTTQEAKPGSDAVAVETPERTNETAPPVVAKESGSDDSAPVVQRLQLQPASHYESVPQTTPRAQKTAPHTGTSILTKMLLVYLMVAAILLVRVTVGLVVALRLRRMATPIAVEVGTLHGESLDLRSSASVASPVTICSAIVLPSNYTVWESEKLRVVLAHERSHVRQGDFYLQLLAGIYAAVVWFSPLGWWLKRQLSDLAEAISDRAGLEEAADRATYAQVLLEFAAAPRPTFIGVAMARSGSLSRRIERLLNDVSFRQAFSGSRHSVAALLVIPIALFCASMLVHVQAAGQAPAAPPAPAVAPAAPGLVAPQAPATPPAPETGVSTPEPLSDEPDMPAVAPVPPAAALTPQAVPAPAAALAAPPAPAITPVAPPAGLMLIAPKAPYGMGKVLILPPSAPGAPNSMAILTPRAAIYGAGYGIGAGQSSSTESGAVIRSNNGKRSGYRYSYSSDGDSYAIVHNNDSRQTMSFNGNIHTFDLDRARKQAHGDFLWFEHDGKSYIIDDQMTLSQIEAMYKPMEELGRQQEELGKKQEALGKQQEEVGRQQDSASVATPDMSREIAEIDAAMAKLKSSQGKNMTQDQFAEIQEKLGELQGKLGEIQGQIGAKQGQFGERMGELGEKMGELGAQQGRLGEEQGRIAQEADRKVKSIIDESLKNGKAHPVQ